MASQSTVVIDSSVFQMRMAQLKKFVGKDLAAQCLPYEAKAFTASIIKVTPPFSTGGGGARKKIGQNAVKRDIRRSMRPVLPKDFTRSPRLAKTVRKLAAGGDFHALEVIFKAMKASPLSRNRGVRAFNPAWHENMRDKYGHVKRGLPVLLVGQEQARMLAEYVRRVQYSVGWTIDGWRAAAVATGASIPSWASLGAPSGYISILDGDRPSITITNGSNKSPKMKDQVRYALNGRAKALASKVQRLIVGKATNLGFVTYLEQ